MARALAAACPSLVSLRLYLTTELLQHLGNWSEAKYPQSSFLPSLYPFLSCGILIPSIRCLTGGGGFIAGPIKLQVSRNVESER